APARSLRTARFYAIFLAADVGGYDSLAPKGAAYALIIGACGVAALGMVEMLRRGKRLVPVCFVVYLLFFVVVTWVDRRYYLPVLPLWLCLLWVGAARIFGWARTQGKWVTALVVSALGIFPMVGVFGTLLLFGRREIEATTGVEWAAAALLLIGLVVYLTRTTPEPAPEQQPAPPGRLSQDPLWLVLAGAFLLLATCRGVSENVVRERRTGPAPAGTGWADLYDAACWLKQNAQPGEAVVSDRMALVWFWSGLQGVPIPRTRDLTEVAQRVQPAQWFILDDLREDRMAQRYLKPYVAKTRGAWEARWHQGETWVLRRKNAAPPP
ncbi:MAG: hypothetical protein NTW87_37390, partial [Planctomycetota bacterium]|nr:hypothetical protein [Planctomycetota bacterium]